MLQKVKIQVFDNQECHKAYFPKFKISIKQWHLCAGTKEGGRGTCHVGCPNAAVRLVSILLSTTNRFFESFVTRATPEDLCSVKLEIVGTSQASLRSAPDARNLAFPTCTRE